MDKTNKKVKTKRALKIAIVIGATSGAIASIGYVIGYRTAGNICDNFMDAMFKKDPTLKNHFFDTYFRLLKTK